jgi:hypothetical protein
MQRRLALAGLNASFWFTFEISRTGTPHMHGAAVIENGTEEAWRQCVRKALGEWPTGARQFQVQTPERCDFRWATYSIKLL